jgi:hypothetical protein
MLEYQHVVFWGNVVSLFGLLCAHYSCEANKDAEYAECAKRKEKKDGSGKRWTVVRQGKLVWIGGVPNEEMTRDRLSAGDRRGQASLLGKMAAFLGIPRNEGLHSFSFLDASLNTSLGCN